MIRDDLRENILCVTFTKKDGSERVMHCTLLEDLIPKVTGNSKPKEGIVTVFDLESQGWRSFSEDSVISVTKLQEDGTFS